MKLGQLMMEELVQMHEEFVQCYGPSESRSARWMSLEELNKVPTQLRDIMVGEDFEDLANWRSLYWYSSKFSVHHLASSHYFQASFFIDLALLGIQKAVHIVYS